MIERQIGTRANSRARWMKAAERAVHEGILLRQLAGSGQWIASSGSDASVAYEVEVTGRVAHGCGCLAGLNDDPVCKHRAAFYLLIGVITLTPEPDTGARGHDGLSGLQRLRRPLQPRAGTTRLLYPTCRRCNGRRYQYPGSAAGSIERERERMSTEHSGPGRGTFSAAHASIQISHTEAPSPK